MDWPTAVVIVAVAFAPVAVTTTCLGLPDG